ncbi:MAG: sigma-70 family RNA polymerase sigma factor [Gemmatimonadetes bacterium]|jgi:RNA polymerase sigma-70 factor (ECF subfamily)|nr:sigma-70 family RNA polymerase sigma factor [Gemmatimonadota bacterium]MBT5142004.1 sigma-70 family RNA polymerase sigma factor [Gemmatimonadota bacterium]MBT5589706.1 sigma-70 family RNA polymerase sigma factor [Gemmatimonadota bacterium]MBT5964117.1 sigma-70 family RNA polymerase sigma factor [Gemmatimonadota bacterium]MBT6627931.1 sigma-70 family RNA polymerase sigma factor [Gemmatimonadota bacterium]
MQRESLAIVSTPADPPTIAVSEKALVKRIRAGDPAAFDEVVRRHHERLIQFVFRLVNDRDDAADVAQDTFIKAHRRFGDFRGEAGLFTWLYRIAYNESISLLRRRKLRGYLRLGSDGRVDQVWDPALAIEDDPSAELESQQVQQQVAEAVASLPPRQRAIFSMRHYEELSHAEIARVIGRSEGAVRANYFHAIRKLRQQLGQLVC